MASRLHRAEILLEPEQHRALSEIADREGRSISELVLGIVGRELERHKQVNAQTLAARLEGLAEIRRHQAQILKRRGGRPIDVDLVQLIDENRTERDDEILGGSTRPGR